MSPNSSNTQPSIVIIGTGFGGLGMAIQLQKAGFENFILLEKEDRIGGTWRDNTYPGAACDVQSHFYSYSFEPKHDWSKKFGLQQEILGYMQHCATKYNLNDKIRWEKTLFKALPAWESLYRYLTYWKNESRALAFKHFGRLLNLFAWQAGAAAFKGITVSGSPTFSCSTALIPILPTTRFFLCWNPSSGM